METTKELTQLQRDVITPKGVPMSKHTIGLKPSEIKALLLFASKDASRPMMDGVGIKNGFAYATDGRRLLRVKLQGVPADFPETLLPRIFLKEAVLGQKKNDKSLAKQNSPIYFDIDAGWVKCAYVDWTLTVGLKTPPYEQVLPKEPGDNWPVNCINTQYMQDAADARSLLIEDKKPENAIRLYQSDDGAPCCHYDDEAGFRIVIMPLRISHSQEQKFIKE